MTNENVRELSKYISYYGIESENDRINIAVNAAAQNGRRTSKNITNYGITKNRCLMHIALIAAEQNGSGTSMYIEDYGFQDINDKTEIARTALLNDPNTIRFLQKYYLEYAINQIKEDPQIADIKLWLKQNWDQLSNIFPSAVLDLYSDMQRRDAGIRLLAGYIGHNISNFPTGKDGSR